MYEGRVEFVTKSLEQLQDTITRKEDNMRVVRDILMVVSIMSKERSFRAATEVFFPRNCRSSKVRHREVLLQSRHEDKNREPNICILPTSFQPTLLLHCPLGEAFSQRYHQTIRPLHSSAERARQRFGVIPDTDTGCSSVTTELGKR